MTFISIYSQKLITEAINCVKAETNVSITEKEAIEMLDSLSGLFLAFCDEGKLDRANCGQPAQKAGLSTHEARHS